MQPNRQLSLDLFFRNNQTIDYGKSVTLSLIESSFTPVTYSWTSDGFIDCIDCPCIIVNPKITTQYFLTITDENGCSTSCSTTIDIRRSTSKYRPNAFSPNGDSINDIFKFYESKNRFSRIETFVIYDRWGNLVFEVNDIEVQHRHGWNGQNRQSKVSLVIMQYS